MPPLAHPHLERRASSSSKTFTIIFIIVIVIVVFICLLWGVIIPEWRKRHPGRPSSTRFNGLGTWAAKYGTGRPNGMLPIDESSNGINHLPRKFPAHPGVMARSDKVPPRPQGAVMVYNPRTETPFPNSPPTTVPVNIPCITPRPSTSCGNLRSIDGSRGPFSPSPSKLGRVKGQQDTGEATEMIEYNAKAGFSDAGDYILAVPAPLALKPRGAGRPPPLTKQLEKFPMPHSSSYASSKEMHPNKLFANLEQTSRKASISDATETTKSRRARGNTSSDITSETSSIFTKDKFYGESPQELRVGQKKSFKPARGELATISSSHIHRAGTITRPRTPVAEYRELYERAAAEARCQPFRLVSLKRELTPSTEPLTVSPMAFSIFRSASTPPTSVKMLDRHLALLPAPLRLRRDQSTSFQSPTPEVLRERISYTPSSAALPESPDKLAPLRKNVHSKRVYRKSIGFYHRNGKPRPAALSLKDSFQALSPQKLVSKKSKVFMPGRLAPKMGSAALAARMSLGQGSSRYSRDTKGVSIARTPVSPDFPTPTRSEFQILQYPEELPRRKSLDLIRSKIDGWNLHTEDMHLDPNEHVPYSLKHHRTFSDLGPRSPLGPTGSDVFKLDGSSVDDVTATISSPKPTIPRICIGSGSEDIFSDENERPPTRGKERLRAEQSAFSTWTTSDSNLSSVMGRIAPGNAEWI
jgi:hypothetical protein